MSAHDRWDELDALFSSVRELSPPERESLLATHSLDADLRHELDELLRAHDALESGSEDAFLVSLDTARASTLLDTPTIHPVPAPPLSPDGLVGRYRIVRSLGRGGMGVIYLARDPRLDRFVALKLLPEHLSVDGDARRRFETEARAASLLDHPNVATVYEVDETSDGRLFIAMAYYDGETLRDKLERGALPIADVTALAAQVANGLKAAHAAGLVHRDVKPANVIVTPHGVAKILDFGIARIATGETTHRTEAAGTLAYMSPEQTHGAPPRPTMDVWSFGVMLYEMLTGVRPFHGDGDESVITAIRNDEPVPIEQLRPGEVPAQLLGIVQRCLRKNPVERYPDAGTIVAELATLSDPGAAASASGSTSVTGARERAAKWNRSRARRYVVAAITLLAILGAGAVWTLRDHGAARATDSAAHSIAVLPFENQLNASDDDHLSAGLSDELITALGAVPDLKVAARTSTFALYSRSRDVDAIADRLGVATVLEGSVRGDTARLRINTRLVQAHDGAVLWAHVYDVPMRDVFTVQEQIVQSIADVLHVRSASGTHDSPLIGRPTADPEAYDLYLRGRYVRTRATRDRLEQALAYFREATERDPGFANAYSGLAETYVNLANFGYVSPTEGFGNANIAAEHAIQLNPRLAEAHASHAYVLASQRAFDRADSGFRRAIALNPNSPLGHHYYSLLLAMLGRTDDALEQNRRARELDPLFTPAATDYGIILCQRGELAASDSALTSALALEPRFALTLYWLGSVRAAEGAYPQAQQLLERAASASPEYPGVLGSLAYVYAREGRTHSADSLLAVLKLRATSDRGRVNLAFANAALGSSDAAFTLLRQVGWDVPSLIGARADPTLRSLRSDPRYAALIGDITRPSR